MQYLRRYSLIQSSFRLISSSIANVTPSTTQNELHEMNKLMKNYNNSRIPIRTIALFEWMINITKIQPDFNSYLHIIRACSELYNINLCKKIHEFITKDQTLYPNEYHQLQIKLIYMYSKIKHIDLAEQIFYQSKIFDPILFGTMFKGYNMNNQPEKTIELYINEILNKKLIELDAISATCVLSACSDCHRLDIGESVLDDIKRLKLLHPPNIRLSTAIINMYCNCGMIDHAQEFFNEVFPNVDHITYSTLMKAYLSINQPLKVLNLFKQLQSSTSISPDLILYGNVINACYQLGFPSQAEEIHRLIPSNIIEKNVSLQINLIDMHAHCLNLNEAYRLFNLLKQKDNNSLGKLIHGYAINGQGEEVLKLCKQFQTEVKFNEQVYKMILYACALTGGLVNKARDIYETIPEKYRTPEIGGVMVSILARASLFDEVELFIKRYQSTSQNLSPLWSALFLVCYHSGNIQYAKLIFNHIRDNPFLLLLYSDMMNLLPSKEVFNYSGGICWTEIENMMYEFYDNDQRNLPALNVVIDELKSVGVNWESKENDLKELFCGHRATRLSIAQNFSSTSPPTILRLTKTKSTCPICHEGMKKLTLIKNCDIILRDNLRVHHFHHGQCSCHDQF